LRLLALIEYTFRRWAEEDPMMNTL
jgi:hypothetical protein